MALQRLTRVCTECAPRQRDGQPRWQRANANATHRPRGPSVLRRPADVRFGSEVNGSPNRRGLPVLRRSAIGRRNSEQNGHPVRDAPPVPIARIATEARMPSTVQPGTSHTGRTPHNAAVWQQNQAKLCVLPNAQEGHNPASQLCLAPKVVANPSVEATRNGRPRYTERSFSVPRGLPLRAPHLKR